jgi:predicted Zn-dependent protease
LMGLAKTLLKSKKSSDVTPYLQEYVRLKPNDAEGYYVLGCALRDAGHSNESAKAFLQLPGSAPKTTT